MKKSQKIIKITESQIQEIVKDACKKILNEQDESRTYDVPEYDNPVFIDCDSEEEANYKIEIGYSSYASSLFYVGEAYDEYSALEKVIEYLEFKGITDLYVADEEDYNEFPNDYIECDNYYFPIDKIAIQKI